MPELDGAHPLAAFQGLDAPQRACLTRIDHALRSVQDGVLGPYGALDVIAAALLDYAEDLTPDA